MTPKTAKETQTQARSEFYRIVEERLDARIARGETYTSTRDLAKGYEDLHERGFGSRMPVSQSVAQVLGYAKYRGHLFYARNVVTHKAERAGDGRTAPYRLYLRSDATTPTDHVLVPIDAHRTEIGEYVTMARGAPDGTVHTTPCPPVMATLDPETVARKLTEVIKAQAEVIDTMIGALMGDGGRPTMA